MAYQYPLNGGRINASIGGNSTSAGAGYSLVSTGTMLLAGGNNITLSQNGQSVSIVGGGGAGVSAGTQSVNTGTVNFANSNGISFGMSGSNQITASFSQSVQTIGGYASGNTTGQSSSSTFDARSVSVSAAGALSAGFSDSALQLSAPAQSSISGTGIISISRNASTISIGAPAFSAGMSTLGNTAGTTGTVSNQIIFAGGNNITLSQSTGAGGNTLTISAANQTNQSLGLYGVGNTTGQSSSSTFDARTLSFQGAGAASVGYSNGSVVISAPNAAAGNITVSAGTASGGYASLVFSNSNNVSFGLSGSTITASAAGGGGGGVALYDGANSISSGTASLSAGGALTASINGQTLSLNAPATSSLSATGAVSIATNGSTISIGAPVATGARWEYPQQAFTSLPGGFGQNILSLQHIFVPYNVSGTAAKIGGSVSAGTHTSASTGNITINLLMGIYTLNGSTLSLVTQSSGSASISFAISSNSTASVNAMRQLTVPMNVSMTPGEYWVGALMNTSTNYASNPLSMTMYGNSLIASANANAILSPIGVHSTASQRDVFLFQGLYSTTISSMPASVSNGHINNTASSAVQRAAFYHAFFSTIY